MGRHAKGELSKHPKKGYRICVGTRIGADGKVRPAVFWLGKEFAKAKFRADHYRMTWEDPRRSEPNWTAESIRKTTEEINFRLNLLDRVYENHRIDGLLLAPMRDVAFPATAPVRQPTPTTREQPTIMLHAALEAYVSAVQAKALSSTYKRRLAETVAGLKHYRADVPLAKIDRVWLEQLTDFIKARPLSRNKNKKSGEREQIKPGTVKTLLQHWRQAFDWLDRASDSDRFGHWEAPKRMNDLFEVDMNKLRTKVERDRAADGPDQLTIKEIVALYQAIGPDNDLHKIVLLMGIFTAQGQSELACTRRDEFDLNAATFTHRRNKTGQRGVYWLPDELVKLLRAYFKAVKPNDDNLAFFTRERSALVTEKSDSVRQMFDDLRTRAEIERDGVTFYACRRFLADRAARKGGDSLRDTALAHSAKTVGGKHYSNFRDFAALRGVSEALHAELTAAGMFKSPAKDEKPSEQGAAVAA
jgi:hypothetical protein